MTLRWVRECWLCFFDYNLYLYGYKLRLQTMFRNERVLKKLWDVKKCAAY